MLTTCTKLVINKLRPAMDNLHNRLKVELGKNKIFTTARKRILKLVKYGIYSPAKFANFVYICITCGKSYHFWAEIVAKMVTFPRVIQTYTHFAQLYFPYFTSFCHQTLQFY